MKPTFYATQVVPVPAPHGPDVRNELFRLDDQIDVDARARCDAYAEAHGGIGLHVGDRRWDVEAYLEALDGYVYARMRVRSWASRSHVWEAIAERFRVLARDILSEVER